MDAFKRRVMGMVQSHMQTLHKQSDLRLEASAVPNSPSETQLKVWEPDGKMPRYFVVKVSEGI